VTVIGAKIDRVRLGVHGRSTLRKQCRIGDLTLVVEVGNPRELSRVRTYAQEEPGTLEWIRDYVKPGDVFYDIGANIGLYAVYAAKKHQGAVRVYAFEPESQNYASLNRNVYLNGLADQVVPFCVALTDRPRIETFNVRGHLRAGEAIHQFGSAVDDVGRPFSPVHKQGMLGVTLDDLHEVYGLPFPNQVKIDVDGQEAAVIAGAGHTLTDERLKTVLVEVTEIPERAEATRAIHERFEAAGLRMVSRTSTRPARPDHPGRNILFARPGE
jgi:FkbM family methyltransferase